MWAPVAALHFIAHMKWPLLGGDVPPEEVNIGSLYEHRSAKSSRGVGIFR